MCHVHVRCGVDFHCRAVSNAKTLKGLPDYHAMAVIMLGRLKRACTAIVLCVLLWVTRLRRGEGMSQDAVTRGRLLASYQGCHMTALLFWTVMEYMSNTGKSLPSAITRAYFAKNTEEPRVGNLFFHIKRGFHSCVTSTNHGCHKSVPCDGW